MDTADLQKRTPMARSRLGELTRAGFDRWTFPLALFGIFLLGFGLFLPQLGFFWDDWVQLLSRHLYGYLAYFRYFWERPSSGWTLIVFGPLLGDSRLGWQFFTLAVRYGTVLSAWWLIQLVWPRYRRDAALAALLFSLYPGFTQQAISVAYSQHWLQYLLFILSLAIMVLATRTDTRGRRRVLVAASVLCQVLQLSITEFFLGVELVRPFLLWTALSRPPEDEPLASDGFRERAWRVLRAWAPYLLVFLGYLAWRFAFQSTLGDRNSPTLVYDLARQPLAALGTLGSFALTDLKYILFSTWKRVLITPGTSFLSRTWLLSWGIAAVTALLAGIYLTRLKQQDDERSLFRRRTAFWWIGIGLVGMILAQLPSWASGQDIVDSFIGDAPHADRFILAAMLWASLFLVGGLAWLVRSWKARAVLVAVLLGVLTGFQVRVESNYRWMAQDQSDFYWELAWRAPAIQPGTALIHETILFPEQGLFATAGAVNLLYPQPQNPAQVAYWVYALQPKLQNGNPAERPVAMQTTHRLFSFKTQTPNSLVIAYDDFQANCLWVLRPEDADYPELSAAVKKWVAASNQSLIGQGPAAPGYPSPAMFGPEPGHNSWCYYFEKADLARQFGDWAAAASLADQALAKGYRPGRAGLNAVYEWLPFMEAYARTGRWQQVTDLLQQNIAAAPSYRSFLCGRLKGWISSSPSTPAALQVEQGACGEK